MKKVIIMFLFVFVSCSSGNEENPNTNESLDEIELIVGSWTFTGGGHLYDDGTKEITYTDCSNTYKFRFFEGGTFESEIWWTIDGICTFDQIRDGNWLKTTNSDYPDSTFRLRFFKIPDDDEEIGYPQIIFEGNNYMRIQYVWENSPPEGVTHAFREFVRE